MACFEFCSRRVNQKKNLCSTKSGLIDCSSVTYMSHCLLIYHEIENDSEWLTTVMLRPNMKSKRKSRPCRVKFLVYYLWLTKYVRSSVVTYSDQTSRDHEYNIII